MRMEKLSPPQGAAPVCSAGVRQVDANVSDLVSIVLNLCIFNSSVDLFEIKQDALIFFFNCVCISGWKCHLS